MHYECQNQNYQFRNNECPKFRKLVQTKTAANHGYECHICFEKLKAIQPPSKPHGMKVSGRGSISRYKPVTPKSGSRKRTGKRVAYKRR